MAGLNQGDFLDDPMAGRHRLRLLSYNIQVGITSSSPYHYFTNIWKHILPASCRFSNLNRIAELVQGYDIVALQELDAGSHRTRQINMTEYLANAGEFSFWYHQLNRDMGKVAQHGNGFLSRFRPDEVEEHSLPGMIPGRGALLLKFGQEPNVLAVMLIHLALGRRARQMQLEYVSRLLAPYRYAVLMGDMNCEPDSPEMRALFAQTTLREPECELKTFPSWKPAKNIDHILVSEGLEISHCHVLSQAYSDHLPVAMELLLPTELKLISG